MWTSISLSETCCSCNLSQRLLCTCKSSVKWCESLFKSNIFNILCFMNKCKQSLNPPVFRNIFTHRAKTKYALRNENSIQEPLCRTNFSQYCIPYRGQNLWNKTVTWKKLTFSDSDFLQLFKRELKRFLLSVELNNLEILK